MTNGNNVTKVIDLRGFRAPANTNNALNEETSGSILYPVYIVLTEGKTAFSAAIKNITGSIYSHASIAFDSTLNKMYSFGVNDKNSSSSGFREEDIRNSPNGSRVNVFTFFVSKDVYQKIVDMVNLFKENIEKTKYGYKNIFTYLFNIPYNRDWKLVCSQFVDRCPKIAGIDITKRDSSLVSPEDINKAAKSEKRIYSVYQGLASNYDHIRIKNLIDSLSRKATPLKEYSMYYRDETSYLVGIISNINNATFLREMKDYIDLVKNPNTRRLLEEGLFDSLEIRAYCEHTGDIQNSNIKSNVPTLDFITEMIYKHLDPIV